MTTQKQKAANRRNAQFSTGPKTPAGLATSSMNALTHGLTAEQIIIFDEDPDDFINFRRELMERLLPAGALEEQLAGRIVMCFWCLRRVYRIEACLFARGDDCDELSMGSGAREIGAVFRNLAREGSLSQLSRYERTRERALYQALHELERLQARRMGEAVAAPAALDIAMTVDHAEPARMAEGRKLEQERRNARRNREPGPPQQFED